MRNLSWDAWRKRALLKRHIRSYFEAKGLWEVDTPILNPVPTVEAHLDSFRVAHHGVRKSPEAPSLDARSSGGDTKGYLVTSPEYNLKAVLALHKRSLFELTHCFREGDMGTWHSEEFLMLEWYLVDFSLDGLMDFTQDFLDSCTELDFVQLPRQRARRRTIDELFLTYTGVLPDEGSLDELIQKHGFFSGNPQGFSFDDKFFAVFLNLIEPHLQEGLWFLYDYPAPLAALSRVDGIHARRFEVYWKGLELANGYEELRTASEYRVAFVRENSFRRRLGKPEVACDEGLLRILEETGGLPLCSGIALGFERLLAVLCDEKDLASLSPFQGGL